MTVPLDKLYHYIESVAQDIRGDDIVIYRFTPHGSKKIEDLKRLRYHNWATFFTLPHIYCNDQEPLDYEYYQTITPEDHPHSEAVAKKTMARAGVKLPNTNLRLVTSVYDKALLLHSEQRSTNLEKYRADRFVPVYYWSHAVIALDWFRFAQHVSQKKSVKKTFLIYNRAWSGSREYRLCFSELLIKLGLVDYCKTTVNPIEPELGIHYNDYKFINTNWKPNTILEDFFSKSTAESWYSAEVDFADYQSADIEVVLETLFDDSRLHLTEKSLRPIAVGQPFILAGTHGSLEYLRRYGFKTFDSVWDESYDLIDDPKERLFAIANLMKEISNWTPEVRETKMLQAREIAEYNRNYFFSKEFIELVMDELKTNLAGAFREQEETNTGDMITWRKHIAQNPVGKAILLGEYDGIPPMPRADTAKVISKARQYYLRSLSAK